MLIIFQFFVDNLAKRINARPKVRDAFNFSKISPGQISNFARSNAQIHAEQVGYFKYKCKDDAIVKFFDFDRKCTFSR